MALTPDPSRSSSNPLTAGWQHSLLDWAKLTHLEVAALTSAHRPGEAGGVGAAGVDGVGVTVLVGAAGSVFAGSNAFTDAVDELQYGVDEGPCLSAVAANEVVTSTSIGAGEDRWPRFGPGAAALALRSVSSVPIVADDDVVGSINVYSTSASGLLAVSPGALRQLAEAAEVALGGVRLLALADAGALRLARVLADRALIERAVGVLMDRGSTDANQARTLLVQLARHDDIPLVVAARSVADPGRATHPDPGDPA